ncbi:ATP-binding cassette domain-containing protein [Agrobacterium tumefaciens]|uniref:cysteine peptidase family C39 domain-containing protein n=1 Tax=Agrobacterium tumefaciens TaxID=358 RepID=UPI0015731F56|nr:ATP-binding cassette domain-containing protein [Agrobacterium tumefaciens]
MIDSELVYQEDFADCGLACLAMVAKKHKRHYDLASLKARFPTSAEGINLAQLLGIAASLGFTTRAVRCELEGLSGLRLPLLLHWGFNHYVVLTRIRGGVYTVLDPATGRRNYREAELSRFFTGVAVEFSTVGELQRLSRLDKLSIVDLFLSAPRARMRLALAFLLAIVTSLGVAAFPIYIRAILEFAVNPRNIEAFYVVLAFSLLIYILFGLLGYLKHLLLKRFSEDVENIFAIFLNSLIFEISFDFFVRKTPGMIARYYQNLRRVRQIISEGVVEAAIDCLTISILLVAAFAIDLVLGLGLLLVVVSYLIIVTTMQRGRSNRFRHTTAADNNENLVLMDNLRNIQAIKLNGLESVRSGIWQVAYRRAASAHDALIGLSTKTELLGNTWLSVGRCALVGLAAFEVLQERASIDAFLSFSLFQAFLTLSLANLLRRLTGLLDMHFILADVSTILAAERDQMVGRATEDQATADRTPALPSGEQKGILICTNISLRFSETSKRLFRDVSFRVASGEFVVITGRSGSGKSTLLRAVTGLLSTETGEITWFGRPIGSWSRSGLVREVATVMQEDQLFSGTVLQNISHFSSNPDMEMVKHACDMSGVSMFIERLPMGLHTPLASNSTTLSAGEKQRLFLARALYTQASVLILDEFTGNLDLETERQIFSSLRRANKTVIMTAHRASTIREADRVLLLDYETRQLRELAPPIGELNEID